MIQDDVVFRLERRKRKTTRLFDKIYWNMYIFFYSRRDWPKKDERLSSVGGGGRVVV